MLKRKITKSKKVAALHSDKARLLWFYMLPFTGVEGRLEADAEDIREEIIRKQRKGYTLEKIEECLQDLHRVGLIILYNTNGKRYLEFSRFWDEQSHKRDREAKSECPSPSKQDPNQPPQKRTQRKRKCLTKEQYNYVWDNWKKTKMECPLCKRNGEFIADRGIVIDGCIPFEIDHKTPISKGGSNECENLWVVCRECNRKKYNHVTPEDSGVIQTTPLKLSEVKLSKDNIYIIFEHWNLFKNQGNWKSHRQLNPEIKEAIQDRLKVYTPDQLTTAITNYADILLSPHFVWSKNWTLREFLTRHRPDDRQELQLYRFLQNNFSADDFKRAGAYTHTDKTDRVHTRQEYADKVKEAEQDKLIVARQTNQNKYMWFLIDEIRPEISQKTLAKLKESEE